MKELPILFNAEMVKAILGGRKTVTRRPIKCKHKDAAGFNVNIRVMDEQVMSVCDYDEDERSFDDDTFCPFGQIGDRLYVRETFKVGAWRGQGKIALDYIASPEIKNTPWIYPPKNDFKKISDQSYEDCVASDLEADNGYFHWEAGLSPCRKRPSIHMPKWAARIWLEITDVRVERVQDITEESAEDEGFESKLFIDPYICAADVFSATWDSIYKNWDQNPWVWVVEFKRIEK